MIGIDITSVERFRKIRRGDFSNWQKFFGQDEWDYCFREKASGADPASKLAGIFAAKEAVMKAMKRAGKDQYGSISIDHDAHGAPRAVIRGGPSEQVELSISHDGGLAVAVAVILPSVRPSST